MDTSAKSRLKVAIKNLREAIADSGQDIGTGCFVFRTRWFLMGRKWVWKVQRLRLTESNEIRVWECKR